MHRASSEPEAPPLEKNKEDKKGIYFISGGAAAVAQTPAPTPLTPRGPTPQTIMRWVNGKLEKLPAKEAAVAHFEGVAGAAPSPAPAPSARGARESPHLHFRTPKRQSSGRTAAPASAAAASTRVLVKHIKVMVEHIDKHGIFIQEPTPTPTPNRQHQPSRGHSGRADPLSDGSAPGSPARVSGGAPDSAADQAAAARSAAAPLSPAAAAAALRADSETLQAIRGCAPQYHQCSRCAPTEPPPSPRTCRKANASASASTSTAALEPPCVCPALHTHLQLQPRTNTQHTHAMPLTHATPPLRTRALAGGSCTVTSQARSARSTLRRGRPAAAAARKGRTAAAGRATRGRACATSGDTR
jgi:hypothetical protein